MPVYVIAEDPTPPGEGVTAYRSRVPELIRRHGGQYLVRGGAVQRLEGDWEPQRLIVTRFPDRDSARRWYEDPEYADLRTRRGPANLVVVDGVD